MTQDQAEMIALRALTSMLEDSDRAARFLSLTGLTAGGLRPQLTDSAVLAGVTSFLEQHEPDLIDVASTAGLDPLDIVAAGRILSVHTTPAGDAR